MKPYLNVVRIEPGYNHRVRLQEVRNNSFPDPSQAIVMMNKAGEFDIVNLGAGVDWEIAEVTEKFVIIEGVRYGA